MRLFPKRILSCAAALVACLFFGSNDLFAASVTPATYDLSRHQVSVSANHEFRFKTLSGVDATGDTIVLTYPSGFSFASIAPADIDLSHGAVTGLETVETLAASAGAGVWGAAIGASSVTLTPPTDAAVGEIAANDFVVIKIGTNASAGSHQITNPASAGDTQIALSGGFGDSVAVSVPIVAGDSVTVTGIVPGTPSGGGGGGGDVSPPVIQNVQAINITQTSATIVWDTDEPADSTVSYGLTISYGDTVIESSLVFSHAVDLSGLSPSTTYHFRVSSRDADANLSVSSDFTFTTLGDLNAPTIANVQVINITDTSAVVVWFTDEPATTFVQFGETAAYDRSVLIPGFTTNHAVLLEGLTPNTLYHFSVTSQDPSNNTTVTPDMTFTTLDDTTAPPNVLDFIAIPGDGVVHLSWIPPVDPDYAGIRIVRRTDHFPADPYDGQLIYIGQQESVDDNDVTNATTYYYGAFSFDANGNFSSGAYSYATPWGAENTPDRCVNGIDDDIDGSIDCADPECQPLAVCQVPPTPPIPPVPPVPPIPPTPPVPPPPILPGIPPSVIPTVPLPLVPGGPIVPIFPAFYGAQGTVQLSLGPTNQFYAVEGTTIQIVVPAVGLGAAVSKAFLLIGTNLYNLSPAEGGTVYQATFIAPPAGVYNVLISFVFEGGGVSTSYNTLQTVPPGRVVEEGVLSRTDNGIAGADVTLYRSNGTAWEAFSFSQRNPTVTDSEGYYAFTVPNGSYYAIARKNGYVAGRTAMVSVSNNIFAETIGLVRVPLEGITVTPTVGIAFIEALRYRAALSRTILQNPELQALVNGTIMPLVLALGLLNFFAALPFFQLITYLRFLFTEPLLLFRRAKKKKWGIVYNAISKYPVDLAIVRLLEATTKLPLRSSVTDRLGRYVFQVPPGQYLIEVRKPGFLFPSQTLKKASRDIEYVHLYHGGAFAIAAGRAVDLNIPLDPVERVETPRRVLIKHALQGLQTNIARFAILASVVAFIIAPGILSAVLTAVHISIYWLFRRLAVARVAKPWGAVLDSRTKKPVSNAVVRVFDVKYNKLLETQVTDKTGKFGFLARQNEYYVTAERGGYEKFTSEHVDLVGKGEASIDLTIRLKKLI